MNLSFLLLMQMASNMGTLCGNLVGALMRTILTDEQLYSWGWRIPFLSGIMIAFVGIYLRLYGEESNNIHADEDEKEDTHWREVFRKENLPALGAATFTPMVSCVCLQIGVALSTILECLSYHHAFASNSSFGVQDFIQHLFGWPSS